MSSDYERRLSDNSSYEPQEPEQAESGLSRLSAAPEDEANLRRLHLVDRLLSSAAMLAPSGDFAERVKSAIRHKFPSINNNAGLGIIIGLFIITGIVSTIALMGVAGIVNIALNWSAVYQWLLGLGGGFATLQERIQDALGNRVTDKPLLLILAALALPLTALWVWLARRLVWVERSL